MKLCFITNYLTHHQLPLCQEFYRLLGDDFTLLVTTPMDAERIRMGWELDLDAYPFAVEFDTDYEGNGALVRDADALICGGTHVMYIRERLQSGKLTFRYFERLYKKGRARAFSPRGYLDKYREHTKYRNAPVYLLCAGAYVPADFSLFRAYPDKMLRFGYFPQFIPYTEEERKRPEKDAGRDRIEILWTGRMIDWKHAEDAVREAGRLARSGIMFHLTMVGEGDHRAQAQQLAAQLGVSNVVTFLPFEKPEAIRQRMLQSDVYLLTSDHQEGWGAVVNEAMNAGCAVIAGSGAGSVPYLIRDGENGLVYPDGDTKKLGELLYRACNEDPAKDKGLRARLGRAAYRTIAEEWNAAVAAERFLAFCERALSGEVKTDLYADGPMSKAPMIAPSRGYDYCRGGNAEGKDG